jgi:hypothetical protein
MLRLDHNRHQLVTSAVSRIISFILPSIKKNKFMTVAAILAPELAFQIRASFAKSKLGTAHAAIALAVCSTPRKLDCRFSLKADAMRYMPPTTTIDLTTGRYFTLTASLEAEATGLRRERTWEACEKDRTNERS